MPAIAYPFKRLFGDVELNIMAVLIDGQTVPDVFIDPSTRLIAAYSFHRADWKEMEIHLSAGLPLQEIRSGDLDESQLAVLFRLNCDSTNLRITDAVNLKSGSVTSTLIFRREFVSDSCTIEAIVTYDDADKIPRIIREAKAWRVALSKPTIRNTPTGRRKAKIREFMDISWIEFASHKHKFAVLRGFPKECYFVDTKASPPKVFLNEGIDGYRLLLTPRAGCPKSESALRELEYRRISSGALLSAAYEALADLRKDDDGELQFPGGWKREVLNMVVVQLFKDDSEEVGLFKLYDLSSNDSQQGYLSSILQSATNMIVGVATITRRNLAALMES